jgi:solute carrier family 25 protein 38
MLLDPVLAGALAGATNVLVLQPFDVVKTRLQERPQSLRAVMRTVHDGPEGLRGYWRGTVPTLVRNVPGTALYFAILDGIRGRLRRCRPALPPAIDGLLFQSNGHHLTNAGNALVGSTARGISGFIFMPITVLKVRFESQGYRHYGAMLQGVQDIVRMEGVRGLFRGFLVTSIRDVPHAGLYLSAYELCKEAFGPRLHSVLGTRLLSGTSLINHSYVFPSIRIGRGMLLDAGHAAL